MNLEEDRGMQGLCLVNLYFIAEEIFVIVLK